MKIFSCPVCQQTLFFENAACAGCARRVAYLPDLGVMTAVEPAAAGDKGAFVALDPATRRARYRPCGNQIDHDACNWAVAADDEQRFCRACRLNEVIPNLSDPEAKAAWVRLETGKRRLLYTLTQLGLPVEPSFSPGGDAGRREESRGLAFRFKKDEPGAEKVFTGHSDGIITINIAEADAPFREKTRQELGEAYRTLLGHFRHEIGHYYWDRLVRGSPQLGRFRQLFGDERADYAAAGRRHYGQGPPADWAQRFVSAYASMHPWEDWAESWAHYLHMVDTLETGRSFGLALRPRPVGGRGAGGGGGGGGAGAGGAEIATRRVDFDDFEDLIDAWVPLTVALNSLNRSMGLPDLYPFVLPEAAIEKLRFVHDVVEQSRAPTPPR